MVADVRLGAVSVDCPDPAVLGEFYKNVLSLEVMFSSEDFLALQGTGDVYKRQLGYACDSASARAD